MAQKCETPKKYSGRFLNCCRLWRSVVDFKHCRNIFSSTNKTLLSTAELLIGNSLSRDSSLPHRLCRHCERRLNNADTFIQIMRKAQSEFTDRFKRVIEISPSAEPSEPKTLKTSTTAARSRRGLHFPEQRISSTQLEPEVSMQEEVSGNNVRL